MVKTMELIGLTIVGGTFPYNYNWSNGAIGNVVGGLSPGTYTVTVTDNNGCTATESYTITQPTVLVLTTVSVTNALCDGTPTGSIDMNVSGGTPFYTYLWSNGTITQDLTNVGGGIYSVTVTDALGCTQSTSINIPFGLTIAVTGGIANIGCEAGNIGSIDVTPGEVAHHLVLFGVMAAPPKI